MLDSELHVGDIVQIKTKEEIKQACIEIGWVGNRNMFCERVVEIKSIEKYVGYSGNKYTVYRIKAIDAVMNISQWLWTADMFNPYIAISEPQELEIINLLS